MRLAEALIERANLQKAISQLERRMSANVRVQEGDTPAEDIEVLLTEYETMTTQLRTLVCQINHTNCQTDFGSGLTLMSAIVRRDLLKKKISVYRDLYSEATSRDRFSRNEIKYIRCIDAGKTQAQIDCLSKDFRDLDTQIQALNWTTDLYSDN